MYCIFILMLIFSADAIVYDTQKSLTDFEAQIDKEEADKIRSLITELKELIAKAQSGEAVSPDELKNKTSELQQASLKLFENVYKKKQEAQDQQSTESTTNEGKKD